MPIMKVVNMQGKEVGEVKLSDDLFCGEVNETALHTVVRAQLNAKRQGRFEGRTAEKKKAIVKLTKDSKKIEFFEGMAQ